MTACVTGCWPSSPDISGGGSTTANQTLTASAATAVGTLDDGENRYFRVEQVINVTPTDKDWR